ncbi:MAG: ribosomal protein S18-alanine N-acetyltransferase [Clostridia bacterium]|nr:ribosomal protein S18-alanine N-acetyltransferase [Clostridia bacterium]
MEITKMTEKDCQELAELDKKCFSVPWSEQSFLEETKNKLATYLLAKDNGKIVGYCGFWRVSGEVQVTNIAVLPEYRRRKIAKTLAEEMLKLCGEDEQIVLEVRKSNEIAISFYKKLGFSEAGIRKQFYRNPDEDGITMIRRIK